MDGPVPGKEAGDKDCSLNERSIDDQIFRNHRAFLIALRYEEQSRLDVLKILNRRLDRILKRQKKEASGNESAAIRNHTFDSRDFHSNTPVPGVVPADRCTG